jgi:hypothetical protein
MTMVHRHFLPDRFRPRAPHRRSRLRYLPPALLVTVGLLLLPAWTVRSVEVDGDEVVPASVKDGLEGLVGHMVPLLELDWLHRVAAAWPAAAEVRVSLELPGTVKVRIFAEPVRGTTQVGRGWHAVAADGNLAGPIDGPRQPELVGFRRPSDRRLAFSVARRLANGSGAEVVKVRQVTPADYRVDLNFEDGAATASIHVTPQGTAAEQAWCELVTAGRLAADWADLRWPHRMVLRIGAAAESEGPGAARDPREAA